jgi:anti-sigma factor RsiW
VTIEPANPLLGPDDPELTCEECFEQLDAYVDHVLAEERADQRIPGMRAHLAGCPACREDFESLLEFTRRQTR